MVTSAIVPGLQCVAPHTMWPLVLALPTPHIFFCTCQDNTYLDVLGIFCNYARYLAELGYYILILPDIIGILMDYYIDINFNHLLLYFKAFAMALGHFKQAIVHTFSSQQSSFDF